MKTNKTSQAIQDKHVEVQYNEKTININGRTIRIELQGKINCPVLNNKISSLTCSKLMESKGWPRQCDPTICDQAHCKIYKSIQKNIETRHGKKDTIRKTK